MHGILKAVLAAAAVFAIGFHTSTMYHDIYGEDRWGPPLPTRSVLLAFGDSHTQSGGDPDAGGYVARLAYHYHNKMDVVNRGFSGCNTSRALDIAPNVFAEMAGAVEVCILFFGTGDAMVGPSAQHVLLEAYRANLGALVGVVNSVQAEYGLPDTRILLVAPPVAHDGMARAAAKQDAGLGFVRAASVRAYAEAAVAVAEEMHLPVVDLHTAMDAAVKAKNNAQSRYGGYEEYLVDGVHLTPAGNRLVYDLVVDKIKTAWPALP
ncbi:isoamyl acetate-hydrolyzing esterase [Coemansia javaensis]|uniref:Isoamyl acetate-hydrolyzing esterase n=1 Tax=Coemansia javaensis TaxID=2761396 RepID=A0A9W8LFI6_9FUNG|nr:isoamyl acetate-hydrolyzing esterase [Coemansia javaensis]